MENARWVGASLHNSSILLYHAPMILSDRSALCVTAFGCGAAVMGVELTATRLLAPYYGTSMVVWTMVIGVILAAMSLGNVYGGRLADQPNGAQRIFSLIWWASIFVAGIALWGKYLISASFLLLLWVFPDSILATGTAASCLFLFAPPCFLLGAATPCLIRLALRDLESSGRVTGELYALSTIGSLFGTFLPTFWMIPLMGTMRTFLVFALVLNVLATWNLVREKISGRKSVVYTVLLMLLCGCLSGQAFAFWKQPILETESLYNYLRVDRFGTGLALSTHVEVNFQSVYHPKQVLSGGYWDYPLAGPLFSSTLSLETPFRVLILGLGTGTFAKSCRWFYPNSEITGVEIDARIAEIASSHFEFTERDAKVVVEDARTYIQRNPEARWDMIFLDTYRDLTLPFHLTTLEFFQQLRERMTPGGVLVINVNLPTLGPGDLLNCIAKTVQAVWPNLWQCTVPGNVNTILFATSDENGAHRFLKARENLPVNDPRRALFETITQNLRPLKGEGTVLTDDLAPIEVLGERILDAMVRDGVREVFLRVLSVI